MKTYPFSNLLKRVAIFLAMVGAVGASYSVSAQGPGPLPQTGFAKMDFNGDGRVDLVFQTPGSSKFLVQDIEGTTNTLGVGTAGARAVPGDYDGDQVEDLAVVTTKGGQLVWQIRRSTDGEEYFVQWGLETDVTVQADYDGDSVIDPAVFRASEGIWYILASKSGDMIVHNWGTSTDTAIPGDYDGDGRTDVGVYRPKTNSFHYLSTFDDQMYEQQFGPFTVTGFETFVSADFDGDGKTDFATYDASIGGMWMVLESSTGKFRAISLAGSTPICNPFAPVDCTISDYAVPADYNYDGKIDIAIWDSKNAMVRVLAGKSGLLEIPTMTEEGMIAVSSFYMTK